MQRKLLYSSEHVESYRRALREARNDVHAMHAKHVHEMASLRAELTELRSILTALISSAHSPDNVVEVLETQLGRLAYLERNRQKPLH